MLSPPAPPPQHRRALLGAAALVLLLQHLVPYGQLVLYPLTLLSTWVHEMGHGVTALLCGGRFERLEIFADASGLAHSAVVPGWRQALTAAGGLLAPPLLGALLLAGARRLSRLFLWLLCAAMALSLVLWVRTWVGWAVMVPLWLLFLLIDRGGGPGGRLFLVQLLGVALAMDTVARIGYLFVQSGMVGGVNRQSDIAAITAVVGGGPMVWGALLAGLSIGLLLLGLWAAFRGGRGQGQRP